MQKKLQSSETQAKVWVGDFNPSQVTETARRN